METSALSETTNAFCKTEVIQKTARLKTQLQARSYSLKPRGLLAQGSRLKRTWLRSLRAQSSRLQGSRLKSRLKNSRLKAHALNVGSRLKATAPISKGTLHEPHGCMHAWMHGCLDAWIHRCINAQMHACVDAWVRRCIDAWMHGCVVAWRHDKGILKLGISIFI